MIEMQLAERHIIDRHDVRFKVIDHACWLSKNLYNCANYILRQRFFEDKSFTPYKQMAKEMKSEPDYQALPRKVSQQVLMQLDHDWRSFFAARQEYNKHPEHFRGRPALPRYKSPQRGRNMLTYTAQAISRPALKKGIVLPSQLDIEIKTQQAPKSINQVRILPRSNHYVVEVVYTVFYEAAEVDPDWVAGIDIGVDNLAGFRASG
jgi:transposase